MRTEGMHGVVRGRSVVTTRPDRAAPRAPDLVERDFTASAPNRLWCVDFTYVPTWSGMCFTAFVSDVYPRRIVGWRTAASMPTDLPLDALEMALWVRGQAGHSVDGMVHHSDAGSIHRDPLRRPARRRRRAGLDRHPSATRSTTLWPSR
jgi:putative transposase